MSAASKKQREFGAKSRTVNLAKSLNWPRGARKDDWWKDLAADVRAYPEGAQKPWGVPFRLAEGGGPRAILVARDRPDVTVRLTGRADFVCFLHEWRQAPGTLRFDPPEAGRVVGEYELAYADGSTHTQPIRARFEVGMQEGFAWPWLAVPFGAPTAADPVAPPSGGERWGRLQTGLGDGPHSPLLVYAMPNPAPDRPLRSLTLRGLDDSPLIVAALTLYQGADTPLRHLPRRTYRVKGPKPPVHVKEADVDLGAITRIERTRGKRGKAWLEARDKGAVNNSWTWTGAPQDPKGEDLLEIAGAPDATVSVTLEDKKRPMKFSLGEAFEEGRSRGPRASLEVLGKRRQWMKVRVIDSSTGKPTPVRIHMSGSRGEYLAPYGHHSQVNTNWFEDYGGDVEVSGQSFAYVPGEFTTDLPVGDVYAEIWKGYEYEPTRVKTTIRPGQKTLELRIDRMVDLRRDGWVTADTHVHFISPQTAWLEGQGEGVNVVNLLASQWGRLFTNVADYTGRVGVVEDDTIVYVGTENRNHMLGHMSMLGTEGLPVFPMCCGGPGESWIGDPDFLTLAEWARRNREQSGVVIRPHFPFCGNTEDPVPILLGLVDALEIEPSGYPMQEWYRYLNCGYRVAACGGTDKMSAACPLGWKRTYAKLDPNREFTYRRWAEAVRAGRTVSTQGPLIDLKVDGREIGDTIEIGAGGATFEVRATAQCYMPLGVIEIVHNGRVVAKESAAKGARKLALRAKVDVNGAGWIAARCAGQRGHPGAYARAHTSPVYFRRGDERLFDGPAATHMLSHVEGGIEYLEKLATHFDASSRRRMVKLFEEARHELTSRLEKEGGHGPHHGADLFHTHGHGDAHDHSH